MINKKRKKGLVLTFETMILIILALAAVVLISVFFMRFSGTFKDRIMSYFSYSNVDSVVNGCNVFVDSSQTYSYCCETKTVKYYEIQNSGGKKIKEKKQGEFTCSELIEKDFINHRIKKLNCDNAGC